MIAEEDQPRPKQKPHEIGQDLSLLSVNELAERIELLRAEIERLEVAKSAKGGARQAAQALFKS